MKILLGSNPGLFLDLRIAYLVEDTVTYISNWIIIMFFYLHPKSRKSILSSIVNSMMSGVATTTLGFPPNRSRFASMSPKVRDTDNLPGKTLNGP